MLAVFALMGGWSSSAVTQGRNSSHAEQLQWFRDAKFGMFIHWGVYSMLGRNEWVRDRAQLPLAEYQSYVDRFNPVHYNPDEWVDLAQQAGMRYMVITAKHHDGFCMFDSRHTEYDIMHAAYGRDALGMLTDACRRKEMVLGFYYSILDWRHDRYLPKLDWETDRQQTPGDFNTYLAFVQAQHL